MIHKEVKEKKNYNKEVAKSKWDLERGRVQFFYKKSQAHKVGRRWKRGSGIRGKNVIKVNVREGNLEGKQ